MHGFDLGPVVGLIAIAVALVSLSARLGLGTVLGYLAAGFIVGPALLGLIDDVRVTTRISEIGVVLLLFVVGLELDPERLKAMAAQALRFGGFQMLTATIALTALVLVLLRPPLLAAVFLGFAMALSSTAMVLQLLAERKALGSNVGRTAFAVLLFQDLIVIPGLIVLSIFAPSSGEFQVGMFALGTGLAAGLLIFGKSLLQRFFRLMAASRSRELFTASALLVVVAVAFAMEHTGLSMGLGAFLAGLALAETEFRHELETVVDPFKGLLLGLFFLSVGMTIRPELLLAQATDIAILAAGIVALKMLTLYPVARHFRADASCARQLTILLSQGGEFGFVILTQGLSGNLLTETQAAVVTMAIIASMISTPILLKIYDRLKADAGPSAPVDDNPNLSEHPRVIIAGFGRFGQIVGRVLMSQKVNFTALDRDAQHVDFVRKFGNEIYFGDATRLDLLKQAHADSADVLVIAVDDQNDSLKLAEMAHEEFPNLKVIARARNRLHVYELMEADVTLILRETFGSSLEAADLTLRELGFPSLDASRATRLFREHDEEQLNRAAPHHRDMEKLIEIARQGREELKTLMAEDQAE